MKKIVLATLDGFFSSISWVPGFCPKVRWLPRWGDTTISFRTWSYSLGSLRRPVLFRSHRALCVIGYAAINIGNRLKKCVIASSLRCPEFLGFGQNFDGFHVEMMQRSFSQILYLSFGSRLTSRSSCSSWLIT